ncbi:MAG TPA: Gldg family protein [Planctomycetota bacterium]|nr:Gldg family protein [Planctomycetota bacterium]
MEVKMAREKQFYEYLISKVVIRTALLLLVIVFGLLAVQNWIVRLDLTEDNRFSISPVSHEIASSLPDPLTIRAYFSGRIPERVVPMQRQVFDILAEYEAHSNGKIKVERYDPLESVSARDEAKTYGVQETQIAVSEATGASWQQVYGSIVLIYGDRAPYVINIAERYPQGYEGLSVLENEISGKLLEFAHGKTHVGITGYLEREGGGNPMMGMQQPRPEFNEIRSKLGEGYELEDVDLDREDLDLDREDLDPKKVPLLVLIRPKEMSDVAVFRLDQYLMKGGRVLCFITEGTLNPPQQWNPNWSYEPFNTGLDGWLEHNGVRVPNEFVLQLVNTNEVPVEVTVKTDIGEIPMRRMAPNWFWPVIGLEDAINADNPAVQQLKAIDLFWPHPVEVLENRLDGRHATVLVQSHADESWRWKDLRRIDMRNIRKEDGPSRGDLMASPLAVAVDGTFTSYFADRPVPPSLAAKASEGKGPGEGEEKEPAEGEEKPSGEGNKPADGEKPADKPGADNPADKPGEDKDKPADDAAAKGPEVVKTSVPTQLVVVGNAVFISDLALGGGNDRSEVTASLALNLVNWLSGSPELIALRAKRYTNRALKDKKLQEDVKAWRQEVEKGDMDEAAFRTRIDEAREHQKDRENRARWMNVVGPVLVIWLVGAVIWVLRAANRSAKPMLPPPEPPQSLSEGGTDS